MRENFSIGSVPFRKAYLQALIDVIEVDDHRVRIKGKQGRARKGCVDLPGRGNSVFADEYQVARRKEFEPLTPKFVVSATTSTI